MKKSMLALAASFFLLIGSSCAGTTDPTVPQSVNVEFSRHFTQAKDVKWEIVDNVFEATFDLHGKTLFAFYTNNADFLGLATNLLSDRLPENLRSDIKKSYTNYWITDLFKYRTADENSFFVTLENPNKVILLKSEGARGWSVYHVTTKS